MKYLNHITLNTGHMRKSYPNEIDKKMYFILNRIYKDSLSGKVEIFEGYKMKSAKDSIGTLTTVYNKNGLPIVTTAISNNNDGELWRLLHDSTDIPLATKRNNPIETPYIADKIEVGAMTSLDVLQWTGDFARCMGWIILAPERIR